MISKVNLH